MWILQQADKHRKSLESFLKKAKEIHGDRYSYKKTIYKTSRSKVTITCRFHGDFQQLAGNHLQGQGCKRCRMSRGERLIESYLKNEKINYEYQYSPDDLYAKGKLYYDFCIKINGRIGLIEYHGVQHYEPITFGGTSDYEAVIERDRIKAEYAKENKIPFFGYITQKL